MSIQAITSALAFRGVAASEKLLLIAWANYADENFRCYPSNRRLQDDTGLSERQIRRIASELESRGLIERKERYRPDGSRSTDLVTLHCLSGGGVMMTGGVGSPCPGGGVTMSAQNLSVEPSSGSKEPSTKARASKRCPDDWKPSDADYQVAADEGLTDGEIIRETAKFRDHTFGQPRSDWSATYRNWIRAAAERKPKRNDNQRPSPKSEHLERVARAMAASVERPFGEYEPDQERPGFEERGVPSLRLVEGGG